MSDNNFEMFQTEVCDTVEAPLPLKKFCPTCTPNKNYIAPDWRQLLEETYLDEAACEYRICVNINNEGNAFNAAEFRESIGGIKYPTREVLFRSFIQPALRLMLEDTDKLIAQQIICASYDGPTVQGLSPNELLVEYDNFDGIFMDLKDNPKSDSKPCPDLISKKFTNHLNFNPEEPMSFTNFVLQNITNEIKNPFALELYARVIDFDIQPAGILKVLVSIPAFILDAVPDNPTADEIQAAAEEVKSDVEIDVSELFGKIFRLKSSLFAYSKYQSHFYQTQDGFLKFKESKKDYYANSFAGHIQKFYEDLKAEANKKTKPKKKRWNIRSNTPSILVKNADKLKITFMVGENGNPYKIKKIEAKIEGCEYQLICGRNSKFALKYSKKPTLMNYIAKINEIDVALQARESYPWLDFLVKFTYPLLIVDYGTLNEESISDTMGECVADNYKEFGTDMKDYILNEALNLVESIAYEFNSKQNCQDILADDEIKKKYFDEPGREAKRETKADFKKDTQAALDDESIKLRGEYDSLATEHGRVEILKSRKKEEIRDATDAKVTEEFTKKDKRKKLRDLEKELKNLVEKLDNLDKEKKKAAVKFRKFQTDTGDEDKINKLKRQTKRRNAKRSRDKEGNPYWKEARRLALEELKTQDGLLSSMVDMETFMTTGKLNWRTAKDKDEKTILQRLSICNVQSLTINAIQCLFSGIEQEAAFKKMVEAALNAMDIDVLGFFIGALPPDKQAELRKMAKDKWANMPMPWEEGYVGGSTSKANPYLNYLGTDSENKSVKTMVDDFKKQIAEIELAIGSQISDVSSDIELVSKYGESIETSANTKTSKVIEHTIVKGDTLGELAKKHYNDFYRWKDIMSDNNIPDEKKLVIGSVIKIKLDVETTHYESSEQLAQEYDSERKKVKEEIEKLEAQKAALQKKLSEANQESSPFPLGEDGEPLPFSELPPEKQQELIAAQKNAQGTLGTALGDIQAEIVDMYIENILDVMELDELMTVLDKFPGGSLVTRYVASIRCSFQGLHNPPLKASLSTLSFDPCGEGNIGLGYPNKMKDYDFRALKPWRRDFLKIIRNKFIEKLETVVTQLLVRMILKLIQLIDDALCKSLNAVGQFASALLTGGGQQGLDEAFKDAFCPDADDNDLDQIKKNAFDTALGKGGLGAPNTEAYDCLFEMMNATMSKQEVIGLLTNTPSNMDDMVIVKMSEMVNAKCQDLADVLGDPDDIKQCFGSMQKYIPPELRSFLKEQAAALPEGPIFDSICLTQDELQKWNRDRKMIYLDTGLDEETAQELVDKANERALNDLGTVAEMMQKGPEGLLAEAIDEILKQKDPACETSPSAIILEDEEMAADKLEMLNDFFKTIEKKFMSDLLEGRNSILSNVLIDSNANRFNAHENRTSIGDFSVFYANFVDSEEHWEQRDEDASFVKKIAMDQKKMRGMFPETVGGRMLQRIGEMDLKYNTEDKNTVVMKFEDNTDDPEYESEIKFAVRRKKIPTHTIVVNEEFHRKLSSEEKKKLGLEGFKSKGLKSYGSTNIRLQDASNEERAIEIDFDGQYKEYSNVEPVMFRNFIMKKSNIIMSNRTLPKLMKILDKWNLHALNAVRKSVIEKPNGKVPLGFNYGADQQQKVDFKDLLYVNPESDPDDKMTWYYNKLPGKKILGKSATEHPRVHFLDPATHGGSYLFPKIYIEPASYNGWLGMVKAFVPEMEVCDDVDNGFLQINNISQRVKAVEGGLPIDSRLSQDPECRFEIPYDRQLTPANHGILEGLILANIRTFGTEFILRTLPVIGSIRLSSDNYDDSLFMMMAQKMEQEFGADSEWELNVVKSYTYYLLFLEQSVQVVQRQIKDGLIEETEEIKAAAAAINKVQASFERTNTLTATVMDQIAKGSAIAGWNNEWESRYENANIGAEFQKLLRFLSPFKLSLSRKLAVIHDTKHHAQIFLSALMKKEFSIITKRAEKNMRPLPHVYDINKYLLSKSGILSYSDIKSGYASVEISVVEGASKPSYGTIRSCPSAMDVEQRSASRELNPPTEVPYEGIMFLEKYVRTINKDDAEQVMTPSEFQQMISDTERYDQNSKISDYFGNATIVNNEFIGTIGVKFGVRLVYVPSVESGLKTNLDVERERVGDFGKYQHIPLVSYEHDIIDRYISEIDLTDENIGEDIKCYVDKLADEDDFKFLFGTLIKTKTFSSLFGIYSYYNFFECIGKGEGEVEEDRVRKIKNKWKRQIFESTKRTIKRQFRATYRSDDDDLKEDSKREKRQYDAKWLSNLLPSTYLGLDSSVRWWQSIRIVKSKPFNKDGDDCLNDFQKLFRK